MSKIFYRGYFLLSGIPAWAHFMWDEEGWGGFCLKPASAAPLSSAGMVAEGCKMAHPLWE